MTEPRTEPPSVADERTSLTAWLDYQRATLLLKCEGLSDEQLRRPMVASGTSLLGLVKHLTEVEHGWFVNTFAQLDEPPVFITEDDPEADMTATADETVQQLVEGYRAACARSREIVARAGSLDEVVPHHHLGRVDLRWVLTHMIEETARHNGHADILREQLDGSTGD